MGGGGSKYCKYCMQLWRHDGVVVSMHWMPDRGYIRLGQQFKADYL